MKTIKLSRTRSSLVAGLVLALLSLLAAAVPTAQAASGTWTQTTSGGLWSATANWSNGSGPIADGTDATADFSTIDITADNTVHLDSSRTIGYLKTGDTSFSGATSAGSWVFDNNATAANVLTLAVSSGIPTITNAPLGTAKTVTISAALAGTQGLFKTGAGNLVLGNKTNSYTGDTTISAGNLQVAGALGSGNYSGNITNIGGLTFNSSVAQTLGGVISGTGTLSKNGANSVTLSVANTFSGNTTIATNSTGALILNHNLALQNSPLNVLVGGTKVSTVTLGAGVTTPTLGGLIGNASLASVITSGYNLCTALTLNPGSGTVNYTNVIADGATGMTLTKTGAGTQIFWGANTYSGNTLISGGTLKLGTGGSFANTLNIIIGSGGTLDVSLAGLTLGSGQTLKASATGATTAGSNTVASGQNLTLSVGGLAFTAYGGGAIAPLTLAGTGGSLVMNSAPVIVTTTTTLADGAYTLVATNGATTVTGTVGTLTVNGVTSPSWASVSDATGALILTTSGMPAPPAITAPATFPAALTGAVGTPSSPTSVAISGSGLTASITATAPNSNLEVSSDNTTYGATATFTQSGGNASGTLYARLSASAAAGTYNSINVVLSSSGATSVNVATTSSGNVVANPYWTATSSGNWGTAGNWYASGIASGSGVTADFSQVSIASDTTVHLETSYTIGNLIFGNTNASPAANWILDNNANSGNTLTLAGGTPTVTVNNLGTGKSATISAEIDGAAGLAKAGPGTLTLSSANNAYSGGTTVSAGTLALSGSGTLGSTSGVLTLSGGTLDLGAGTPTVGAVSITAAAASGNTITNGTLTGSSFTANVASGTATVSAALAISGNATNSGAGTLVLNPGAGNTNTVSSLKTTAGGLTLNSGTLNVTAAGTPQANGLWINGGTVTVAGGILTANTGTYATINGGGTLAVSSGTANIAGAELLLGYGATAGTVTVSGTGVLNVPQLRVSQTTGLGTVNLNGGTLQMNNFADTGSGGTVNFNGGTVQAKTATTAFTVVNANLAYKVQAGGAIITNAVNITIGAPLVHDAALGGTPDGGLTKLGSGTLTLTNANTYTGTTTISNGVLAGVVGGSCASSAVTVSPTASGTSALSVSVSNTVSQWTCASLTTSGAGAPVLDFNFGATTPSGSTAPLVVTGAATFTTQPTVTVDFSGTPTLGTYPLMTMASTNGTLPTVVTIPGVTGNYQLTWTGSGPYTMNIVITGIATSPFKWAASGSGTWDFTSLNWKDSSTPTPGIYAYADTLAAVFDDTYLSADTTVTLNTTVSPGSMTANNSSYNYTISGSGAIAGSSGLTKSGSGTLTLATANSYTGGSTVSAGTLAVSGSGTLGTNTGALTLSGGTLDLGGNSVINGAVSITAAAASGDTIKNGSLTGTNYAASVGSGNAIVSAALLTNGTAGFTMSGAGTVTLAGANTYAGTTLVTGGTLNLTGSRTAAAGNITVRGNAALGIGGGSFSLGANTFTVNSTASTTSTVNHTNGSISFTGGNELIVGAGANSTGIYNLSGGTLTTVGFNSITNRGVILGVGASCSGTFNLSGTGTLDMSATDSTLEIGRSDLDTVSANTANTTGTFNQTGGSATVYRLGMGGAFGTQTNTTSRLNLSGGTFSASVFSYLSFGDHSVSSISISNTADVTLPPFPNALGSGATATVTLNGGILRPAAASAGYLGGVTSVDIMAGGAAFGVASGNDISITQNLLADGVSTGGGLTKSDTGNLTLSGVNTYTGNTTISAGKLVINGDQTAATGNVSVSANATLGGNGTVGGAVTIAAGGSLAPGASVGRLTINNNLTLNATSTNRFEFDVAGSTNDRVACVNLTPGSSVIAVSIANGTLLRGTYRLFDYSGTKTGTFGTPVITSGAGANTLISIDEATANQINLLVNNTPVATNVTYARAGGVSLKIAITNLMSNVSDVDGDATFFVGVSSTTTNGGTLIADANYIYVPTNNVTDSFTYTVRDNFGGTNTGTVTINISGSVFGQGTPSISTTGGNPTLGFAGIPGYSYTVERGTNVNFTGTVTSILTTNAPAGGLFQYTDENNPPLPTPEAFYRLKYNP